MSLTPVPVPALDTGQAAASDRATELPTRDLLERAIREAYVGPAWDELAGRLVRRAFPDLERGIRSGAIYGRCHGARCPIRRETALQSPQYAEDIAAEAVEETLTRFRTTVLPAGEWDPDRGAGLEEFFIACCLPTLANRWRWYLRRLCALSIPVEDVGELSDDRIIPLLVTRPSDPADIVGTRDELARTLPLLTEDDRTAFVLRDAGWTCGEIAGILGVTRNALDKRLSRARKHINNRRPP